MIGLLLWAMHEVGKEKEVKRKELAAKTYILDAEERSIIDQHRLNKKVKKMSDDRKKFMMNALKDVKYEKK